MRGLGIHGGPGSLLFFCVILVELYTCIYIYIPDAWAAWDFGVSKGLGFRVCSVGLGAQGFWVEGFSCLGFSERLKVQGIRCYICGPALQNTPAANSGKGCRFMVFGYHIRPSQFQGSGIAGIPLKDHIRNILISSCVSSAPPLRLKS